MRAIIILILIFISPAMAADPVAEPRVVSAAQLLKLVESGEINRDIEIYHIQGQSLPQALKEAILRLRAKGHTVQGTLLTPEQFEDSRARLSSMTASADERANNATVLARIAAFKNRLFGTPEGITFFRFFKRPFQPNRSQVVATAEALAIANPILLYALTQMHESTDGIRMAAPMFTLSAWIVSYIFNINQIAALKGQGGTVEIVPSAPAGNQIQVKSNKPFVFATTLAQEVILNSLLLVSMFPVADLSAELLLNALANAPLSTFAKTPFEAKISDLMNESEQARRQGDIALADKLSRKAIRVERMTSNYLFPALKLLHLVAPALTAHSHSAIQTLVGNVSWMGLVATGVAGMGIELYRKWSGFRSRGANRGCEALILVR